ncbi:MAG: carboxypeptidase-like regulatory domain-containing protein [Bacteroidales bacterium]|nr:carboxypeptidase-like regulatory domain-containing protein [Bacteroidales bacterium]
MNPFKLSFILIILLPILSLSQNRYLLTGIVTDEQYIPLSSVNIYDGINETGTTTNRNGRYFLNVNESSVLVFSFAGRRSYTLDIEEAFNLSFKKSGDTLLYNVQLPEVLTQLPEVEVVSDNIQKIPVEYFTTILDYEIFGDSVLLLKKRGPKRSLAFHSKDSVLSVHPLDLRILGFEEDCMGNLHMMSRDTAYCLEFSGEEPSIKTQIHMDVYDSLIRPCLYGNERYLIYGSFSDHNKRVAIDSYDKVEKKTSRIAVVEDRIAARLAWQEYYSILGMYNMAVGEGNNQISIGVWDGNLVSLIENRELMNRVSWFLNIESRPVSFALLPAGKESFMLFDHVNDTIREMDCEGNTLQGIPALYASEKNWKGEIIADSVTHSYYIKSEERSLLVLRKIDMESGEANGYFKLKGVPYPEKVKLFDGNVYFLFRDYRGARKLYWHRLPFD